jgi:2-methylcitrate dehydratase PrpD
MGPGFATKGGITAALMAEKGITGAKNSLEGEMGLYNLYHRKGCDVSTLTSDLGKRFEGINVGIKRYPCCGIVHPFIDAALALVHGHDISAGEVDKITAFRGEGARYLCEPLKAKQRPRNPVDSQFSVPWAVAVAVTRNKVSLDDFTEAAIEDEKVLEISEKVTDQLDKDFTRSDNVEPGRVEITMKNGESYSKQMNNAMGYPPLPVSFDDCVRKFFDCAAHAARQIPKDHLDRVVEMVERLERVDDATEVIGLVSRA